MTKLHHSGQRAPSSCVCTYWDASLQQRLCSIKVTVSNEQVHTLGICGTGIGDQIVNEVPACRENPHCTVKQLFIPPTSVLTQVFDYGKYSDASIVTGSLQLQTRSCPNHNHDRVRMPGTPLLAAAVHVFSVQGCAEIAVPPNCQPLLPARSTQALHMTCSVASFCGEARTPNSSCDGAQWPRRRVRPVFSASTDNMVECVLQHVHMLFSCGFAKRLHAPWIIMIVQISCNIQRSRLHNQVPLVSIAECLLDSSQSGQISQL